MIFKILGCGTSTGVPIPGCRCTVCTSGKPRNQRSRTSALIKVKENYNILIDTTTDLRYQALTWDVRTVNAVLYTHAHADHILGLDDLRGYNFVQNSTIPCYGTAQTLTEIKRCFSYVFDSNSVNEGGMVPQLALHEIVPFRPFSVGSVNVIPFQVMHGKMPVMGFRIGELAYATDCNHIPDESKELLQGIKVLVLDALRYEPHNTHFTIPQAIKMAEELQVETTYFIHMTHSIDYDLVNPSLPANMLLAYDGLEINF